jgi:hypothetical protein
VKLTALDIIVMTFSAQFLEVGKGVQPSFLKFLLCDPSVVIFVHIPKNGLNDGIRFGLMRFIVCRKLLRVSMVHAINSLDLLAVPASVAVQIMEVEKGPDVERVTETHASSATEQMLEKLVPHMWCSDDIYMVIVKTSERKDRKGKSYVSCCILLVRLSFFTSWNDGK